MQWPKLGYSIMRQILFVWQQTLSSRSTCKFHLARKWSSGIWTIWTSEQVVKLKPPDTSIWSNTFQDQAKRFSLGSKRALHKTIFFSQPLWSYTWKKFPILESSLWYLTWQQLCPFNQISISNMLWIYPQC